MEYCQCERCGVRLQVGPAPGSEAKLLRRSKVPKGFCVNCAAHNFLRNTYPPNIQLAESGPKILLYPIIQEKFADIMRTGLSDAAPDEIDWQRIVDNWELPFSEDVKPSDMNPCSQVELDEVAAGTRPGPGAYRPRPSVCEIAKMRNHCTFDELNKVERGLGDSLKKAVESLEHFGDAAGQIAGEIADAEE